MKDHALQPIHPQKQPAYSSQHRHIDNPILGCVVIPLLIGSLFVGHFSGFWTDDSASVPVSASSSITSLDSNQASPAASSEGTWSLILVNRWNALPHHYQISLTQLSNGQSVDTRIYPALQQLFHAARSDGLAPIVASGYRTTAKQQNLLEEKTDAFEENGYSSAAARKAAETWVAVPGTSEHQLGLAVDINGDGIHSTGDQVYHWLNENAYKYGFILRYPADKVSLTGTRYEPWHYRYVGITAATQIHQQGICLEEYLAQQQAAGK